MATRGIFLLFLLLCTLADNQMSAFSTRMEPETTTPPVTTESTTTTTTTVPTTTPDPVPYSADLPNITFLDEAVQQGHEVFMFKVSDNNGGLVIPSIVNDVRFRILPVSGDSSLWRVVRTEHGTLKNDFQLTIQLKDEDGNIRNATLYIFIIGNNPPIIPSCPGGSRIGPNVPARTGVNATVDMITAVDNDIVTYTMTCTPSDGPFIIDYATGRISTSRTLRFETEITHTCSVTANDGKLNHNSTTCDLTIVISDINLPPVFASETDSAVFTENMNAPGSVLYPFTPGILQDPNDATLGNVTLSCSFAPTSANSLLELNTTNKAIKLQPGKSFDYETEKIYTVSCVAQDDGGLKDNFTLTINVLDGNDPPVFQLKTLDVTMEEGQSAAAATNLNLLVKDEDGNDTKTFSLSPGLHADKFTIDSSTGVLTHKGTLGPGIPSATYTVNVKVTDKGQLTDNMTVMVVVLDANDHNPKFASISSLATTKLHLRLPFGTVLGAQTATDADAGTNADITYSTGPASNCSGLRVNENGMVTVTTSPLGMAYNSHCTVEVTCTDKGKPPLPCENSHTFYFEWEKPPVIEKSIYDGEISEDAAVGSCVPGLTINVDDTDAFTCTKPAGPAPLFDIKHTPNAKTAQICFKGPGQLDRNTPVHSFVIVCTDSNPATSTASITVRIKPNQPPKCPVGTPITPIPVALRPPSTKQILVTDPEGDTLECSSFSWAPANAPFSCNSITCECTSTEDTMRADTQDFFATVTVRDKRNEVKCNILFKLDKLNEPPKVKPVFPPEIAVLENSQDEPFTPKELFSVTFEDSERCSGGLSCTTAVTPAHYANLFKTVLVGDKVTVTSTQRLNKEEVEVGVGYRDTYDFTFQCSDGCKTMNPITTTLRVNNVNEKPVFRNGDMYFATFRETETTTIVPLNCDLFDPDTEDTITWKYTPAFDFIRFVGDPKTCSIRLITEYDLDRIPNTPTVINYIITATDKGGKSATATVRVNFVMENDNFPKCMKLGYNEKVYYGTQPASAIVPASQIKVVEETNEPSQTDLDRGVDGHTTCRLKEASNGGARYVDVHSDCEVVLTNSMDGKNESGDLFNFVIEICDGSISNQKCGYCRLTVQYVATTPPPPVTAAPIATGAATTGATTNSTANAESLSTTVATTTQTQYSFVGAPYVFNVSETEMTEVKMGCVACNITGSYAVYLENISPTCNNCFQVYNDGTQWCAYYVPGQLSPSLSYNVVHKYSVKLLCRNDDFTKYSSTLMEVHLSRNQQATFNITSSIPLSMPVKCSSTKQDVFVSDAERDTITCNLVSVSPASLAGSISVTKTSTNPANCEVRCIGSLESACEDTISVTLSVTDDKHLIPVYKTVNINLSGRTFPTCTAGCGKTHTIPESANVGAEVGLVTFNPSTIPIVTWDKSTAASLFEYTTGRIVVRAGLDYDNAYTRTSTATFIVSDGFCNAPPYLATVVISDVNYPPEVTCLTAAWQYEEDFTVGPIISITDKDSGDTHTSKVIGNNPFCHTFNLNYLTCTGYDHDLAANTGTILVKIEVSDGSSLGANKTVANCTVQIKDKNDNPPRFEQQGYTFEISDCTEPGVLSPRMNVTDLDSAFQGNNLITVNAASHVCGGVTGNGAVYVTSYCPIGVHTMTVTATDHGQYPGPLTSANVTVTFVVGPCSTTSSHVTQPTNSTTAAPVSSGSGVSVFAWAVPLALLGLAVAALSALACYRHCCKAKPRPSVPFDSFQGHRCHTPPQGEVAPCTSSQVKPTLRQVQEGPVPRAPIPRRLVTQMSPSPYMFNFWQESYQDADYVKQPNRCDLPANDTF